MGKKSDEEILRDFEEDLDVMVLNFARGPQGPILGIGPFPSEDPPKRNIPRLTEVTGQGGRLSRKRPQAD